MAIDRMTDWTVMVYMAGDNNLSADMVYALEKLKTVAYGKKINLFVYYDGLSEEVPTLYCNFSYDPENPSRNKNLKLYPSYKVEDKLIDVNDEFNENSAAVNNIINFVHWCEKRNFVDQGVEKKYAFIISGHTFGFVNKGLFKDEKADYSMTYPKLKYMFERITDDADTLHKKADEDEQKYFDKYNKKWDKKTHKERRTPILGKKLDLLGFDTCVMSTLEIGCQFSKFADTMVASEGSIPTAGWNYAEILLSNLNNQEEIEPKKLAVSFVDKFIKIQNKFALADISVDISAWDLTQMNGLEKNLAKLAEDLMACFEKKKSPAFHQMKRLIVYVHWQCQTYLLEQHIDLGDFCQLLLDEICLLEKEIPKSELKEILKVKQSCREVVESIKDCILLTGFSGSDFQFSNGISLFFPWSWACYQAAESDYNRLTFVKKNSAGINWNNFLKKFLKDVTLRHPNYPTALGSINADTKSVVYQSYNLNKLYGEVDFGRSNSTDSPKDGKQFPNSAKQFPNSARLTDQFSVFLARFMKLKNNLSNWNWAGYKSKHVVFKLASPADSENNGQNRLTDQDGKIVIKIPISEIIQKKD